MFAAGVTGARGGWGGDTTECWAVSVPAAHGGLNRTQRRGKTRECRKFSEGKRDTEGLEQRADQGRHLQAPGPILGVKSHNNIGYELSRWEEHFLSLVEASEPGLRTEGIPWFQMAVKGVSGREGSSPNHPHREEEHKCPKRDPGTC